MLAESFLNVSKSSGFWILPSPDCPRHGVDEPLDLWRADFPVSAKMLEGRVDQIAKIISV